MKGYTFKSYYPDFFYLSVVVLYLMNNYYIEMFDVNYDNFV